MNTQRPDTLRPLEAWHRAAAETLPGLSFIAYDLHMKVVSHKGEPPLAAGVSPSTLQGVPLKEVLPEPIWTEVSESVGNALGGKRFSFEIPLTDGGRLHWIEVSPILQGGQVVGGVISSHDVAERMIAEQELLERSGSFETVFSKAPIGMAMIALDGSLIRVNPAFHRITGYGPEEIFRTRIQDMVPPEDHERDLELVTRLLSGETATFATEQRLVSKSGKEIWAMVTTSVARDESGAPVHLISQIQDATERRELELELRRVADEDPLTGLANRRRLEQALDHQIERSRRHGEQAVLLLLDLDEFKSVNDTYGHSTGDELLVFVAHRLSTRARSSDIVARPGGDEFAVIAMGTGAEGAATLVADLTRHLDTVRFDPDGRNLGCRASVGAAVIAPETTGIDDVLKQADREMYKAKQIRQRG